MDNEDQKPQPIGYISPATEGILTSDANGFGPIVAAAGYDTTIAVYLSPPPAAGWHEEVVPRRLLNERDNFIVSKGLWSEFVDSLKATDEALRHNAPPDTSGADAGVRVKPLEWNEYEREGDIDEWDAETAFGTFYGISRHAFCFTPSYDSSDIPKECQSPDEAKAVCQADYEHRVLSALSHQSAPVATNASAEERLREALAWAVSEIELGFARHKDAFPADKEKKKRFDEVKALSAHHASEQTKTLQTKVCQQCHSRHADKIFLDDTNNFNICGDCWAANRHRASNILRQRLRQAW